MKRVVVTGFGAFSPIGNDWLSVEASLRAGKSGIVKMPEWSEHGGLRTQIAGKVEDFSIPEHYDRKNTRSMGRGALLATVASEKALQDAELLNSSVLTTGDTGIAYGSCLGSPDALMDLALYCADRNTRGIPASSYMQVMSHCCASNISLFIGITGRIIPTCSACTSGSQAIGFAYETIRAGTQKVMVAGGAEELCVGIAALFDSMYATSTRNEDPETACRPFSSTRDGLVISEGACSLVLEELSHAEKRGAEIYAEVVGFGTNSCGSHITNPNQEMMRKTMELSLKDAGISPELVGYVHSHATATQIGDIAESRATYDIFSDHAPVGALKSYIGHTLGATGALEAWMSIEMMRNNWFAPIAHLEEVDQECAPLDYIKGNSRNINTDFILTNNFAFGGVNTSLIFKRI